MVFNVLYKSLVDSSMTKTDTTLSMSREDSDLEIKPCCVWPRPEKSKVQLPHSKFDNSTTTIQQGPNSF